MTIQDPKFSSGIEGGHRGAVCSIGGFDCNMIYQLYSLSVQLHIVVQINCLDKFAEIWNTVNLSLNLCFGKSQVTVPRVRGMNANYIT